MKNKVIKLRSVDSTNEYCKRLKGVENAVVVAKKQTAGKGTKGRSFVSDKGGLYISVLKTYDNFDGAETFKIMLNCCVAVCRTMEKFKLSPVIRWANDVLIGGRKICGTLIENTLSLDKCRSIVGMGINVNNRLPEELKDIGTSIGEQTGRNISVRKVMKTLLKYLEGDYTVDDYKGYINWFGQNVTLNMNGKNVAATALDVDVNGLLVCRVNGEIKKISSAEVSLRL
ncbi:MAG: biotin--[acetyl-CoA-carboxylase] ligase [Candidatus Coproplasma sp.]